MPICDFYRLHGRIQDIWDNVVNEYMPLTHGFSLGSMGIVSSQLFSSAAEILLRTTVSMDITELSDRADIEIEAILRHSLMETLRGLRNGIDEFLEENGNGTQ